MRLFRISKALVLGLLLAASLSLNIATVAIGSVATLVSGMFEAVTGAASVVGGLRDDGARKSARIAALTGDMDAKELQLARLSDDLAHRDRQLASAMDEAASLRKLRMVDYRGEKRLLGEAVSDTSARVSQRMTRAAARNVGSLAAEAIPVAGIAVIVGVTAWDIHDSCETMKDLHELDLAFNPQADRDPEIAEVCGMRVPTRDEVWSAVKSSPATAWETARHHMPDLPNPKLPPIDWSFWD